jgi:hypothetical protein
MTLSRLNVSLISLAAQAFQQKCSRTRKSAGRDPLYMPVKDNVCFRAAHYRVLLLKVIVLPRCILFDLHTHRSNVSRESPPESL